ncbi:tetraacyldisaccharide 4'-kinase [Pedobacter cryophilus]|uniref:Tetraacyldisaccharide 4'-kinase n=1 Tax=Pedobacter cryophilus TaxID=2571271 RepID=A0A4U1C058_9SPHI|nr:tetraacyldisaccharide 4'-kinase [Pedobacter cryophilus]TKB98938.1 tetraacyldisaccharide 4'-kinase [Pedobacter cryophilus]
MHKLRYLLFPFSLLYGAVIFIRNKFYDWGFFKSTSFQIPIISVGNLEVGGSGKTPMVEYILHLLQKDYKTATLSRGYGRKTKGFRWVKPDDEALNTGDEPLQIKQNFLEVGVAVCENRVAGINEIQKEYQLILMDDAYQHRAVKPGLSILLFDYHQLQKPKLFLPAGNYREPFSGRNRADILIITKTPNGILSAERQNIKDSLKPFLHQKVFFSGISYHPQLQAVFSDATLEVSNISKQTGVLLLTGIAKTQPLVSALAQYSSLIFHHAYPDHHQFSQKNMLKLVSDFKQMPQRDKIIVTTQKDAVRLRSAEFQKILAGLPIFEWKITVSFDENEKTEFDHLITKYAQSHQRIN